MEDRDYQILAAFRRELLGYLAFSKIAVQAVGLAPQQYQALLAIKGRASPEPMTATALGRVLFIRHNSAVELTTRLCAAGLVERHPLPRDRRMIELRLTAQAEALLDRLSVVHRAQLRERGPELVRLLRELSAADAPP